MSTIFKLGDVVTYRREFLRATGQLSGPIPFARGRIISLSPVSNALDVATIDWGEPDIPARVLTSNLIRADRLHLESY
jgi:hypothetical protein